MAGGAVKHDYHLVDPSPWPFVGSLGAFLLAIGFVVLTKGLVSEPAHWAHFFLGQGQPWFLGLGFLIVGWTMVGWWGDVIKESKQGDHTPVVDLGLRWGMILFIVSEVMFFAAWFWMFFELALFHDVRAGASWDGGPIGVDFSGWESWPPPGIETFDPFHLPLINTLILLLSGTTVTWAHHALQHGDRKGAKLGLLLTVILGVLFTCVQAYEYTHAYFDFSGSLYGATFFMATGFHGAHVIIGTIFLAVCLARLMAGHFTPKKHFGFEAAAWYWHFVDVVWLFLFVFIYVAYA
ncbi:cytochrome c oxidase subunit 3 [Alkalicaulis satelles]|uniref:Cytochrome c oxidase subunit 3 n=1 Tax=Alkalicaulis satelles TaxID=2609175 RepID=A0A5M6ZCQ8_9PROT|nr:cytochrome c oxidase subunit 3 [Alkalicaulis satelles]KAA5801617.1 cytochrome c oxidase subunit 3 [Alkalicaulis satelles]